MNKANLLIIHAAFIMASIIHIGLKAFVIEYPEVEINMMLTWIFVSVASTSIVLGFVVPFFLRSAPVPTKIVVSGAFFESIGIYGLVGGFIGMPDVYAYGLLGAGTLFLVLNTVRVIGWVSQN